MNYLDLFLALVLVWFAFSGYRKGLIVSVASLAALILGIYVAIYFSDIMVWVLTDFFAFHSKHLPIIAFILTFLLVVMVVVFIGRTIEKLIDLLLLGFLNKLSGAIFGVIKGALIISLFIWVLNYFDTNNRIISEQNRSNSFLFEQIESIVPTLYNRLDFLHDIDIKYPFNKDEDRDLI